MIKSLSTAEHYTWGSGCDGWRLLDGVGLAVVQERMPGGTSETRHVHRLARQLFFVLSGELTVEIVDRIATLKPGDAVEVAPGHEHVVRNSSEMDVTFLVISSPSTRGDRDDL
jgi:mannose-6-phosphate isomerase-like protein (cupin superfamily)